MAQASFRGCDEGRLAKVEKGKLWVYGEQQQQKSC
jgi:hypothetical protein